MENIAKSVCNTCDFVKYREVQAVKVFAEMLIEEFINSADNQELSTVKGIMKNVCPAKVNKIRKRFERWYE